METGAEQSEKQITEIELGQVDGGIMEKVVQVAKNAKPYVILGLGATSILTLASFDKPPGKPDVLSRIPPVK